MAECKHISILIRKCYDHRDKLFVEELSSCRCKCNKIDGKWYVINKKSFYGFIDFKIGDVDLVASHYIIKNDCGANLDEIVENISDCAKRFDFGCQTTKRFPSPVWPNTYKNEIDSLMFDVLIICHDY